jgi:hypothetical protein
MLTMVAWTFLRGVVALIGVGAAVGAGYGMALWSDMTHEERLWERISARAHTRLEPEGVWVLTFLCHVVAAMVVVVLMLVI